jgi:hypothetical protein
LFGGENRPSYDDPPLKDSVLSTITKQLAGPREENFSNVINLVFGLIINKGLGCRYVSPYPLPSPQLQGGVAIMIRNRIGFR